MSSISTSVFSGASELAVVGGSLGFPNISVTKSLSIEQRELSRSGASLWEAGGFSEVSRLIRSSGAVGCEGSVSGCLRVSRLTSSSEAVGCEGLMMILFSKF